MFNDYMKVKSGVVNACKKRKTIATEDTKEDIIIDVIADIIARDLLRDPDFTITDRQQVACRANFKELCRIHERYEELKKVEKDGKRNDGDKGDTSTEGIGENTDTDM